MLKLYLYLTAAFFLLALGRVFLRRPDPAGDWDLVVAFIRLEFPPDQRDTAQKLAAGFAEILGLKVKQLRPEHTIQEIADLAEDRVYARDLVKILCLAYGIECAPDTTFRSLVEKVTAKKQRS